MTLNEYIAKLQEIAQKDNNGNKILVNSKIEEYSSFTDTFMVENIEEFTECYDLNNEKYILLENFGTYL